jgi:hypothetical protein
MNLPAASSGVSWRSIALFFVASDGEYDPKTIKVLGICGSLRRQSTNMNLLRFAQENAPPGMQMERISGSPFTGL